MKSFAEWIAKRDLHEQGGLAGRTRTIYPTAYNPWAVGRTDISTRGVNPLFQLGTDILGDIGSVIRQKASPKTDPGGGGYDPSTLIRVWDAFKKEGKIVDGRYIQLEGVYPDHPQDIPIAQFCKRRDDMLEMLTNEGFSRPRDMLRRICGHTDNSGQERDGLAYDEEWLAVEIIKRRMINQEIRPKGFLNDIDTRHVKDGPIRRFEKGGEGDYQLEVQMLWPIYEDSLERLKRELK